MRVAVIGSGIAGLGVAWSLRDQAEVILFERQGRLGGHSHTVRVAAAAGHDPIDVDTGFIVYNVATYPNLIALFDWLKVPTKLSDMSFAVSLQRGGYEYAGDSAAKVIGHWQNLFRVCHWRLIADALRFMRQGHQLCAAADDETLGAYLARQSFSQNFIANHVLPMAAAIWSAAPSDILDFPARSFGLFYNNHGLLELDSKKRPDWRTVNGGAQVYIHKIIADATPTIVLNATITRISAAADAGCLTFADGQQAAFDHVIIATHADEAAALLDETAPDHKAVLAPFRYATNRAYLHSDARLMPRRRNLWASWNYVESEAPNQEHVFVTYWMNRLQGIDRRTPLFVSLNPSPVPAPNQTIKQMLYHHPQYDRAAMQAQKELRFIQGRNRLWLCGSYFGYGFHEDALASGLAVAEALGARRPWQAVDVSPAFDNATPVHANG